MNRCVLFLLLMFIPSVVMVAQELKNDSIPVEEAPMDSYDSVIAQATASLSREEFEQAREYYKRALELRPADRYSTKMIHVIDRSIWANTEKQLRSQELSRKAEINTLMKNALTAIIDKKYDTALALYKRVLTLKPVKSQQEFAEVKIRSINEALGIPQPKLAVDSSASPAVANEKKEILATAPVKTKKNNPSNSAENKSQHAMLPKSVKTSIDTSHAEIKMPAKNNGVVNQTIILVKPRPKTNAPQKKMEEDEVAVEKVYKKPAIKKTPAVVSDNSVKEKVKEKPVPQIAAKAVQKTDPSEKKADNNKADNVKEERSVDALLSDAAKAINVKNYKEARELYQKVLTSNSPPGKKEFARMVIKAIDQTAEKDAKTTP